MNEIKLENILAKVEELKKKGAVDLSTEEDLAIAVMNLVSLEEHFVFTHAKTGKPEYLDLVNSIREIRKKLLGRLVDRHEGETWCISKHLLATTMRLIEVGTKLRHDGKSKEAEETLAYASKLFSIFWALRLKLIDLPDLKQAAADNKAPWSLEDIMNKLVDCCDE